MIIYQIQNKITGRKYIGQTRNTIPERWQKHLDSSRKPKRPIHHAIKKYGSDNFEISELHKAYSEEELNQKEIDLIKELDTIYPNGYNVSFGGGVSLNPKNRKPVTAVNALTGDMHCFNSITAAARNLKCPMPQIINCLKGRTKIAKGYLWYYENFN